MTAFSFKRFAYTLRYLGYVRWRAYINWILIPFAVSLVTILMFQYFVAEPGTYVRESMGFFCLAMLAVTSKRCVDIFKSPSKQGDELVRFLVLPASNVEKFVSLVVMRIVLPVFDAFLGCYLAVLITSPENFVYMLTYPGFDINQVRVSASCQFDHSAAVDFGLVYMPNILLLSSLSVFVFVGTVVARCKWILAFFVQVLALVLSVKGGMALDGIIDFDDYDVNFPALIWWVNAILTIVFILMTLGSYWGFKRRQAVTGRFLAV